MINVKKKLFSLVLCSGVFFSQLGFAVQGSLPILSKFQNSSLSNLLNDDYQLHQYKSVSEDLEIFQDLTVSQVLDMESLFDQLDEMKNFGTSRNSLSWITHVTTSFFNVPGSIRAKMKVGKAKKALESRSDIPQEIVDLLEKINSRSNEELLYSLGNIANMGVAVVNFPLFLAIKVGTDVGSHASTVRARNNALELKAKITASVNAIKLLKHLDYNDHLKDITIRELKAALAQLKKPRFRRSVHINDIERLET